MGTFPEDRLVHMPLYQPLAKYFFENQLFARVVGFLIMLGNAFLLNYIVRKNQLLSRKSWLPALMFVVFSACTPGLLWPHASLFASFFLLLSLLLVLETYRQDKSLGAVFHVGLMVGLAAQFYLPALVFLIFHLISLLILRPFIWREWVVIIIGAILPFIYVLFYFFMKDHTAGLTREYIIEPIVHRSFFLKLPLADYVLAGGTGIVLLGSMGRFIAGSGTSTMKTKKGISVLIWFMVLSLAAILPAQHFGVDTFVFTIIPVAFFTSNYFLHSRKNWMSVLSFWLILAGIVFSYLFNAGIIEI
ncbi:MAG: hypothetical protein Fur0041_01690 [Bacteroidia bacterium]